jgi:hypothetical protein
MARELKFTHAKLITLAKRVMRGEARELALMFIGLQQRLRLAQCG